MQRRTKLIAVGVAAVVAVAGVVAVASSRSNDGSSAQAATPTSTARSTAKVVRQDLVATTSVGGTLTYGTEHAIKLGGVAASGNSGTGAGGGSTGSTASIVTALPELGTVLARGEQLFERDGAAGPVLFYGERPMWRTLVNGVDDGVDVLQLEQNLAALGFTDNGSMAVDNHFTLATGNAVAAWQESRGLEKTGSVAASDVVYESAPVRVASYVATVGDSASATIYNVTGTRRAIEVALDPANQSYIKKGGKVTVTLPDDSEAAGVVESIGSVATVSSSGGNAGGGGGSSTTTIPVTIVLTSNPKGALDESPVTVNLVTSRARNVLTVPVNALLALAEGGYAVEKVNADGTTTLVKATPGKFANGFVEITGDVSEGETVVSA